MFSITTGIFLTLLHLLLGVAKVNSVLFFPASSVLQITASMAIPIILPGRKVYIDYGYQFNFELPWNPAQFYNPNIWPTRKGRKRDVATSQHRYNDWNSTLSKYDHERGENGLYHPHDFTAGELYQSMENTLMHYGFHATCLLRSVCELARHPFADGQQNILTETLTFVLTPSLHNAFAETENVYREVYEQAEQYGFFGADCARLYDECKLDILSALTKVLF